MAVRIEAAKGVAAVHGLRRLDDLHTLFAPEPVQAPDLLVAVHLEAQFAAAGQPARRRQGFDLLQGNISGGSSNPGRSR
ncbi:hypothetical protein AOA77_24755 [Pseudomonas paraeruginosa]|nr:hypothetical protein AN920_07305 [Pseudomonas paraeruginosa]KQB29418.1 hypothetical protein AOA77_24755 [Pseudomonas paraeruginosa]